MFSYVIYVFLCFLKPAKRIIFQGGAIKLF